MPSVLTSEIVDEAWSLGGRQHHYTAKYRVKTDDKQMSTIAVAALAMSATPDPLPNYFSTYVMYGASDPSSRAQTMVGKRVDDKDHASTWEFDVEWSPLDGSQDDDHTSADDPLTRPLQIDMDFEEVEEIVENAWNEEELPNIAVPGGTAPRAPFTYGPITNAAGQQPDTPVTRVRQLQILIIKKNFVDEVGSSALDQIVALQQRFVGKLSNGTFYGAPERKALCRSIRPSEVRSAGGVAYREAEFRIAATADGFSYPMVNCGWKNFVDVVRTIPEELGGTGLPETFRELSNAKVRDDEASDEEHAEVLVAVSEPVNLELTGYKAEDGKTGTVIHWHFYDVDDFGDMDIGGV